MSKTVLRRRTHVIHHNQCNCKLLQIPYDVRRRIYEYINPPSVHIFEKDGGERLLGCVPCPTPNFRDPGKECKEGLPFDGSTWDVSHTQTWASRLQSSWGPHWKCEEKAEELGRAEDSIEMLLRVSKVITAETIDLINVSSIAIVSDIKIIDKLLWQGGDVVSRTLDFASLRKQRIISKLPTQSLETIERQVQGDQSENYKQAEDIGTEDGGEAVAWMRLSSSLAAMPHLRELHIWLDRREPYYWTKINERAILDPLLPLASRADLDVCIELPRHYDDDTTILPFRIQRRLQQRCFGHIAIEGHVEIIRKTDFPMLHVGDLFFEELSAMELEQAERNLWREGLDMEHGFIIGGMFINRGSV